MSTNNSSGSEQEGGDKPSFDKPPQAGPPPGAPSDPYGTPPPADTPSDHASGHASDRPPGYGAPYGAPPGGQASPYGGSPYGAPYGAPPPGGSPYGNVGEGPVPGMPPLGSWSNRIVAKVLDFLMMLILAVLVSLPFADLTSNNGWIGPIWLAYAFYLVYEGLMLGRDGQTVGKKLFKLRVAMLVDGSIPTGNAAWIRSATFVLPAVICCGALWWPVDGLFGVFDKPYRQCIHDKAAKTVVISTA
ncbi:RDD family protein [Kitasatospora sp. NPDC048540]|uniref:RDD family protein n=1 Tax=unclassified Kitasatospora TaxID=2633591 RepID=UPI00053BBE99|nr:RDD family protein [Kitasatospora sp. MBT63]